MVKFTTGGVCAPKGFRATGIHVGIKKGRTKKDLALIVSDVTANAAAVYTTNLVKAAPLLVTKNNLADGKAQAIICNSGIANACVADGVQKAEAMCRLVAKALNINHTDVIVASTGVIGQSIDLRPIEAGIPKLVSELSVDGGESAVDAIMTTDLVKKEVAVSIDIDGQVVKIGGIAKGSGMINPNMATMLAFLTTDADIKSSTLQKMLKSVTEESFNRVSVDGDTSTNDMLVIMANGLSGVKITGKSADKFQGTLSAVCVLLAKLMAKDGEGATKLIECSVTEAPNTKTAKKIADSIINSPLVKTAMFGADANWGRIMCAIGYSGARVDVSKIDVAFCNGAGRLLVCKQGMGVDFCEDKAAEVLKCDEVTIDVKLNQGNASATAWGCDLSYDYVKINGDYRS
ncbi:MAG: bifunctional glutamate N-acetyltransferase/amino-acid acetyltransferase ArgJ [Firmicutes bacterium]|nr:bifunctional glutamate N-acetyltransferase/amino-acid acetyltransferase ArgJ [Bacillota bacterium]